MTNDFKLKLKQAIFAYNKIISAKHIDDLVDVQNRGGSFLPMHGNRPPQSCLNEVIVIIKHKLMMTFGKHTIHSSFCNDSFYIVEKILKHYEIFLEKIEKRCLTKKEYKELSRKQF